MSKRVTINDFRAEGLCVSGIRESFAERGVDFRRFVREGMDIDEARKYLPDAFVARAIANAEKRTD